MFTEPFLSMSAVPLLLLYLVSSMDRSKMFTELSPFRSALLPLLAGGVGGGVVGGGVVGGGVVGGGVGGGVGELTVRLLGWLALCPVALVQVRVKVVLALRLVRFWVPEVALLPFQLALVGLDVALQEAALVELQVKVDEPGLVTVVGLMVNVTVGLLALVVTDRAALWALSLPALSRAEIL